MRLSAAKSRMGHAEPAAGAIGISSLADAFTQQQAQPLLHLRQVSSCASYLQRADLKHLMQIA